MCFLFIAAAAAAAAVAATVVVPAHLEYECGPVPESDDGVNPPFPLAQRLTLPPPSHSSEVNPIDVVESRIDSLWESYTGPVPNAAPFLAVDGLDSPDIVLGKKQFNFFY